MNKQEILNKRRKELLKRIKETPEGRAYLDERTAPNEKGVFVDAVKNMENAEIQKVEKILESISRVSESQAMLKEIKTMNIALRDLAEKKAPAPVVNVAPPVVRVNVPEAKILNETKTEVLVETKYQEETAKTLLEVAKTLQTVAKNTSDLQVARIKNAMTDAIPVQLVNKAGKAITDFSDIPQFMSTSSSGGSAQYTENETKPIANGTLAMWKSGNTMTAASTAAPFPVAIISGAGSGGTAAVDNAAFTTGTTSYTPTGGVYKSTRSSLTDGSAGVVALTAKRGQYVTLETPLGVSIMSESLAAAKVAIVDGSGTQITSFGGGTQYADGAARGTATGTVMMVDDGTLMQSASGDSSGRLNINVATALPAGSAIIGKIGIDQTTPGTTNKVSIGNDGTVAISGSVAVTGTFWQATQPVSIASSVAVTGPLTDTQLRASAVPISAASLPLPTGAATETSLAIVAGAITASVAQVNTKQINGVAPSMGNGVSGTGVQRVTLASDGTGVVGLNAGTAEIGNVKNSGTFAVQAAQSGSWSVAQSGTWNVGLSTGTNTIGSVKLTDGTTVASVRALANAAINVAICDASGNQITTFGGGSQYVEDVASVGGETMTLAGAIRQDTPVSTTSADGDYANLKVDSVGRLWSHIGLIDGTVTVDSELPAAVTLADATTNPSTTSVGSLAHVFNGTTWDRVRSGVTTPSSTFTGMQNTMPWAKYDATPTARTTGQGGPLQADVNGSLQVNNYTLLAGEDQSNGVLAVQNKPSAAATYAPSKGALFGSAATLNIKASPGNVFAFTATNTNAAVRYLQLHNTASTPAASAVPVYTFMIPIGGMVVVGNDFFTNAGAYFSTGIAVALSTAAGIYTAATAAEHYTCVHYI